MVHISKDSLPEVVISGIGGCFPQSKNVEELKKKLLDQVDVSEQAHWEGEHPQVCNLIGAIPDRKCFDATFFKVHRKQAELMDPMGRILLEKTFEAIIDAGINPMDIQRKKIGVFISSCLHDNDSLITENSDSGFGVLGQSTSMIANRISFWLNTTGPSYATDGSWLGGMQSIEFGYKAIASGEIDAAIVGSCNMMMNVQPSYFYSHLGLLNKDGKTKAFDENADGYTRADGICVFYLQRADLAKRHYATIVNCNVEFNGHRTGHFSDIKMDSMTKFITNFYKKSNVDPKDVQYVETHGCGIKVVDETELEALDAVYNKDRKEPLLIGAVKPNLGHAESSASMFSIIKLIIAMETGIIPGTLNYETPNKNIPALVNGRLQVVSENWKWTPSLSAVNGIGLISSFGHILLKPNPRVKKEQRLQMPILNLLSTRTEEGIKEIIADVKSNPVMDPEYSQLIHDIFVTTIPGHIYRGYVIHGKEISSDSRHFDEATRQTWFIYSGMGSQWKTMGKGLLNLPIFAESVNKCHKILEPMGLDLIRIITDDDLNIFDNILNSFVGIAAIQIGLTDVLQAIGIVPDGIIGHSVGELGCAYVDGCLTAEQTILSAYYRGIASLEVKLIDGMMAAIGMSGHAMKPLCPPSIDIACYNSSTSCTLSGPKEELRTFVAELQFKKIFARLVNVSNIAYHSRYIKPAAPLLLQYLKKIIPTPVARSAKWISTSVPESAWDTKMAKTVSPEYLTNNLLSSVQFENGCKHIPTNAVAIEIAPHGLLQAILKRSLPEQCINISLTKKGTEDTLLYLYKALGNLYMNGLTMNVSHLYPHVEYPVSRGTKSLTTLVRWFHDDLWRVKSFISISNSNYEGAYMANLNCEQFRNLVQHRVGTDIVIPITAYLPLICNIFKKSNEYIKHIVFEDIVVKRHIVISEKDLARSIFISLKTHDFEITDRYGLILVGRISASESYQTEEISSPLIATDNLRYTFSKSEVQNELKFRNYQFSGVFNCIQQLNMYNEDVTAKIEWRNDWATFVNSMLQVIMLHNQENETKPILPTYIRRLIVNLDELPNERQDFNISYHHKTGLLTSPIVQIKNVTCKPYEQEVVPLIVETYSFIKFTEVVQDFQTRVNICLQIVQQDLKLDDSLFIINEIKDGETSSLENYINIYSERYFASKFQLNVFNDLNKVMPNALLTIISERYLEKAVNLFERTTKYILVSLPATQALSFDTSITSIYSFHSDKLQYHLLKQVCDKKPMIINIESKHFNSFHLNDTSLTWVNQLLESLSKNQKIIYLVSNTLPENGIEIFLKDVKSLKNGSNVRLMFLLDANLPKCIDSNIFYNKVFEKDLPVTVFKNGSWGSYFKTPYTVLNKKTMVENYKTITTKDFNNMFHDYNVKYLGLNTETAIPNEDMDDIELGPVEFTGYDKSGQRVMGIARAKLDSLEMIPDPDLVWPIPDKWSLIEGATIPYAYANAYYMLFKLVILEHVHSMLIHNGCSSFGQAVIQIALQHNIKIYTTVGSDTQRSLLLKNIKELSPQQVMSYTDTSFQTKVLLETKGKGVNLIINCLPRERMQAAWCCLSILSRVINVDISDSDLSNTAGLRMFLYCSGMHGFTPKHIFDRCPDIKSQIHAMVSEGIKNNTVQPLQASVVNQSNLDSVLRYLKSDQVTSSAILPLVEDKPQMYTSKKCINYTCNKKASYIVFGDDTYMLLNTIRWLVVNGAKFIVVFATSIQSECNQIKRCFNALETQHNTYIQLTETSFDDVVPSMTYLREINEVKQIEAVLNLNRQTHAQTLKYVKQIDAQLKAINSTAHLICFWENQIDMTYNRLHSLPMSNVKWESSCQFHNVVNILEDILNKPADILIRGDELSATNNFSSKDFFALLASSQDSIIYTVDSTLTTVKLIQVATTTPWDLKDATPMFIVPGLLGQKCKYLKSLIRNLLCPIYIINSGSNDSLQSTAAAAVKQIKEKVGSAYNIIGVSFGGALALEITKLLEEQGEQIQLYLIDGAPETIQNIMHENGNRESIETSLLSSLLRIDHPENIISLRNVSNWNERVKTALRLKKYTVKEAKKITEGLHMIKNKLDQVLNYKPTERAIIGTTRLIRPQVSSQDFSYNLINYCKQLTVEIVKGNHFTVLEADQLAKYINETVILPKLYQ